MFVPVLREIDSITRAYPGVVTTTENHGYYDGAYVRLSFPQDFGMPEVNHQVFLITVLSDDTFSLGVDTSTFIPYSPVASLQEAQVVPVGETTTLKNATHNNLTPVGGGLP